MFPRRQRSLLYKLLIGVPLLWLIAFMFFYSDKKAVVSLVEPDKPAALVQDKRPVVEDSKDFELPNEEGEGPPSDAGGEQSGHKGESENVSSWYTDISFNASNLHRRKLAPS